MMAKANRNVYVRELENPATDREKRSRMELVRRNMQERYDDEANLMR